MKYWSRFLYWLNERKHLREENEKLRRIIANQNRKIIDAAHTIEKLKIKHENQILVLKVERELKNS